MRAMILDYGAGNLHSLAKALTLAGATVSVCADPRGALDGDMLVLPGVGAFGSAAERLAPARTEIRAALRAGHPCLGICLGMQLLFESSEEGAGDGIGLIAGTVTRLRAARVPQIGWNSIDRATDPLLGASGLDIAWFANGYACRPTDESGVSGWCDYESDTFPCTIRSERTLGVQFHPEKSSRAGLRFIEAFVQEVA